MKAFLKTLLIAACLGTIMLVVMKIMSLERAREFAAHESRYRSWYEYTDPLGKPVWILEDKTTGERWIGLTEAALEKVK